MGGAIYLKMILFLSLTLVAVVFQNCAGNFSVEEFDSLNSTHVESQANSESSSEQERQQLPTTDDVENSELQKAVYEGFVFKSEYRNNPQDMSGILVCDFPSEKNCLSDAQGKSKGRMREANSNLDPSAKIHKISFDFYSSSYFSKNREAHFAIGLRGKITKDEKGDPIAVNGRGFIIGQLGSDSRNVGNLACQRDMGQIETYHGDAGRADSSIPGNHIFSESCTDSIFQDGRWYHIEVLVSRDRKIGFKVFDDQGGIVHKYLMQDPTSYIDLNLNDWFFGHVFDTSVKSSAGNWHLIVKNIILSQSNTSIESNFENSLWSLNYSGKTLADNSLVQLSDLKSNSLSVGAVSPLRTRIYGCTASSKNFSLGACSRLEVFRVINMPEDQSFFLLNKMLYLKSDAFAAFPSDTYTVILRANPQSAFNQAMFRVLND
jgi:hypothetical protein